MRPADLPLNLTASGLAEVPAAAALPGAQPVDLQARLPALSQPELRTAFGRYATGVTVVTCLAPDGRPVGLTVNSFTSLSLDPALVLWSLRLASGLLPVFEATRSFAVNVLAADQQALSQRFASAEPDKFGAGRWRAGLDGLPLLDGCVACFECAVEAHHPHGDHVLYIGRVLRLSGHEGPPLLYHASQYHRLGAQL
jgi:flavin reductase (DIM6/NTAB) family NADH-FMN oxidoreductase RutF